jgi:hypothetical protein
MIKPAVRTGGSFDGIGRSSRNPHPVIRARATWTNAAA